MDVILFHLKGYSHLLTSDLWLLRTVAAHARLSLFISMGVLNTAIEENVEICARVAPLFFLCGRQGEGRNPEVRRWEHPNTLNNFRGHRWWLEFMSRGVIWSKRGTGNGQGGLEIPNCSTYCNYQGCRGFCRSGCDLS